jgi:hypothetical protein
MGSFSTADLDRIKRVIASGALTVRYDDGRLVTYRSLEELAQARAAIELELGVRLPEPTRKVMAHSKGVEGYGAGERRGWGWWE